MRDFLKAGTMIRYKNICGKDFETKSAAYKHFRTIVNYTGNDHLMALCRQGIIRLGEETKLKNSHVQDLFDRFFVDHDWMKRKTKGRPIRNYVLIKDDYGGYCLGFQFDDDSYESITAKQMLTCFGKGTISDDERFLSAMRYEVKYQSEEYRRINDHKMLECYDCCAPREAGLQIDHLIPFKQILADFLKLHDKEEMKKRMSKAEEQFYWRLDERDRKLWCDYHKSRAVFQFLCRDCHRAKTTSEIKIKVH